MDSHAEYPRLQDAVFIFPAIDNHAHPLLRAEHRNHQDIPFEGVISEAGGLALNDSIHTLAGFRATSQLASLFQLNEPSWDNIKAKRSELDYIDLCKRCIEPTGIQCILIDDGLGTPGLTEGYAWHDQFTQDRTRRIVRIEVIAEEVLNEVLKEASESDTMSVQAIFNTFSQQFCENITASAIDEEVAAFKSIVCYRSGLDVSLESFDILKPVLALLKMFREQGRIRLQNKPINDYVVRTALEIAGRHNKPVQFHTGLGDDDITLRLSSPSHLQAAIKAYPNTTIVLLHSSYPFTREAGYLTSVYHNVYLDFGEIFPFVSTQGQVSIVKQVLELSPTNKILWSTDGHWWPESYYLGTIQARQALYLVLSEIIKFGALTETQAVKIAENALFHNANRVYNLNLQPHRLHSDPRVQGL